MNPPTFPDCARRLIGAAGRGSNLLLNIGPTPEGEVRPAHRERLLAIGEWLKVYGETIYGTRKSFMKPAPWGVAVEKGDKVYLHILDPEKTGGKIELKELPFTVKNASHFGTGKKVRFSPAPNGGLLLEPEGLLPDAVDQVIVLTVKKID